MPAAALRLNAAIMQRGCCFVTRKVFDADEQERLRAVHLMHRLHDRPLEEWEEAAKHLQTSATRPRPAQRVKMFRHPRALPPYNQTYNPNTAQADRCR
jgi:hypothetical protein